MTSDEMQEIARLAIQGMEPKERVSFLRLVELGKPDFAAMVAKEASLRTINRNIRMASMAISSPAIMAGLVSAVEASL